MNGKELKIGNWVYVNIEQREKDVPVMVTGVQLSLSRCFITYEEITTDFRPERNGYLSETRSYFDIHFNPILITPQRLLEAGFEWDFITFSKPGIMLAPGNKGYDVFLSGLSGGINTYVIYLHQLQNLHFALTGTELEVKLQ